MNPTDGQAECVLCETEIDGSDAGRTDNNGHPAYEQRCPSCGWFVMEAPASTILKVAEADGARTRKNIVDHFREIIRKADKPAIITHDDAQAYCYPLAFATAEAVHDRLMNGPIRELQESVGGLVEQLGTVAEAVGAIDSKVDNLHDWMKRQDERINDLETRID